MTVYPITIALLAFFFALYLAFVTYVVMRDRCRLQDPASRNRRVPDEPPAPPILPVVERGGNAHQRRIQRRKFERANGNARNKLTAA